MDDLFLVITLIAVILAILVLAIKKDIKKLGIIIIIWSVIFAFYLYYFSYNASINLLAIPILFIMIGIYFIAIGRKSKK